VCARGLDGQHRRRDQSAHREVPSGHEVALVAQGLRRLRGPLGRTGAQTGGQRATAVDPAGLGQGRPRGPLPAQERERQDGQLRHDGRRSWPAQGEETHVEEGEEETAEADERGG